MNNNPNVYIGKVVEDKWGENKEMDDDELLKKTAEDVIEMLGFDPLDEEESESGITVLPDGSAFFVGTVGKSKGRK